MEGSIGLQYFNARWYDSYITQFSQPDSIIPDLYNPLDWNRYSYVRDNPINFTDKSGHHVTCDAEEDCNESQSQTMRDAANQLEKMEQETQYWKDKVEGEFGVKVKDGAVRWSQANLQTMYSSLSTINNALRGNLGSMIGGTVFLLWDGGLDYKGITGPTGITFYVKDGNFQIPAINFFHEVGHLIDSVPATHNVFSNPYRKELGGSTPGWVKDGYVNRDLLGNKFLQPVQAYPLREKDDPNEFWADAFANVVADNVILSQNLGKQMSDDVYKALGY